MDADRQPPKHLVSRRDHIVDTGRRLLTAVFVFTSLFLFIRTFALEPFGVPTGSMADTLLGNHREVSCPRCGFPVVLGEPGEHDHATLADATCPNCGQRRINLNNSPEIPGDRLLVDKNVFQLRKPRRWEVCVFRCPVDDSKPYVKRVVGLPGEAVQLLHGDVYANGELQRKTLKQCRECWVLAFDQSHAPAVGWGSRWQIETLGSNKPAVDAGANVLANDMIVMNAETEALGLTYRNWNLDTQMEDSFTDWLAYNGTAWSRGRQDIHDFAMCFDLEVTKGTGSFACRLFDGLDSVSVEFPIGGKATFGRDGGDRITTEFTVQAGQFYRVEFSFFDRRMCLAIDGRVIPPALDLAAESLDNRKAVSRPVQFGAVQANVTIRNFKLYRDVHLRNDATYGTHKAYKLAPDQYFVLGDNSNNSKDSREWAIPGVPEKDFLGKPFLIHQPLKLGTTTLGGPARHYHAIDWGRLRWVR